MTLRLTRRFDQHYACVVCKRLQLDGNIDVDHRSWTCVACHHPISITLADPAGNRYQVERHPARHLAVGDQIVYLQRHDLLAVGELTASSLSTYKEKRWFLTVKGFGYQLVDPDHYFNRIPRLITWGVKLEQPAS